MTYPPYTITSASLKQVAAISEWLGAHAAAGELAVGSLSPQLRRENRIRTIHASLAIENNTLSMEQVTDIIDGKTVIGPLRDIQEVHGAVSAYEKLDAWHPHRLEDLLDAHAILMCDLVEKPGRLRTGGVGVFKENRIVHMAPPAHLVHEHLTRLLGWLEQTDEHPLVASCVFHYEFEFIHPFADGNGRMGRLWQTLILSKWNPLFAYLPVETLVRQRQAEYYASLAAADELGEATPFVEFMLAALFDALIVLQSDQGGDQVNDQVRRLLEVLGQEEKSAAALMAGLGLRHAPTFRKNYLSPALGAGLVERTRPDAPRSPFQKYTLTEKGRKIISRKL
ncbi:MAG: Fic family protein [Desulfovibrio sp.]|uniref:Fic family protein n=1 Tax=Desulfovibrio sp. TaxID=885 RepID=UPI001A687478|nr:Fic family protein [Desulfovibrio sp.]MBD5416519.1 Fic family protein [Desulfovibrio sp.]